MLVVWLAAPTTQIPCCMMKHLFPLQVQREEEALKGPRQWPNPRSRMLQPLSLWSRK